VKSHQRMDFANCDFNLISRRVLRFHIDPTASTFQWWSDRSAARPPTSRSWLKIATP